MIEELISAAAVPCRGGFIAYYNDMSLYSPDPALPFSRAVCLLIAGDGRVLICPIDLTVPEPTSQVLAFREIDRAAFGTRSTGALFVSGRYFSIHADELAGSYQISDDLRKNDEFPTPRAYRRFLLMKTGK